MPLTGGAGRLVTSSSIGPLNKYAIERVFFRIPTEFGSFAIGVQLGDLAELIWRQAMISNRFLLIFKIIIVVSFSYATFRHYIAPNEYKDLLLAVMLTCGMLAVMYFDSGNRKYTTNTNILKSIILIVPLSYTAYRLLLAPNENSDTFETIWIVSCILAMFTSIWGRKKTRYDGLK